MKIIAVIVAYNRQDKIKKAIECLFRGELVPDALVVVNNNSTDNTLKILNRMSMHNGKINVVTTSRNFGGSGGFCIGLKKAYDLGATHFWIMDDDCYALVDSLEKLYGSYSKLNAIQKVGFVCSRVDWVDGNICNMNQPETTWDWMSYFSDDIPAIKVTSCSFVSCFISREILEEFGLPLFNFFIWFDDVEFTKRLSSYYPCFAIMNSRVFHDTPVNEGVFFAMINKNNYWKYRYGAMNESWYRFKKESPLHWLLYVFQKNIHMIKGRVKIIYILKINLNFIIGVIKRHRIIDVKYLNTDNLIK